LIRRCAVRRASPRRRPGAVWTSDIGEFLAERELYCGLVVSPHAARQQYAIRMAGVNGRLRVFSTTWCARLWREP
jgi:hypothetical protein